MTLVARTKAFLAKLEANEGRFTDRAKSIEQLVWAAEVELDERIAESATPKTLGLAIYGEEETER